MNIIDFFKDNKKIIVPVMFLIIIIVIIAVIYSNKKKNTNTNTNVSPINNANTVLTCSGITPYNNYGTCVASCPINTLLNITTCNTINFTSASLLLYFSAENVTLTGTNNVSSWLDISNNKNNAQQTVTSAMPSYSANGFNNKPCVVFNGSPHLVCSLPIKPVTGFTIAIVGYYNNQVGYDGYVYVSPHASTTSKGISFLFEQGPGLGVGCFLLGDNMRYDGVRYENGIPYVYIITASIVNSTTTFKTYRNGVLQANVSPFSTGISSFSLSNLCIGSTPNTGEGYHGAMSSFLLFDQVLSDSDRQSLEAGLMHKWWSTNMLPTTNNYY